MSLPLPSSGETRIVIIDLAAVPLLAYGSSIARRQPRSCDIAELSLCFVLCRSLSNKLLRAQSLRALALKARQGSSTGSPRITYDVKRLVWKIALIATTLALLTRCDFPRRRQRSPPLARATSACYYCIHLFWRRPCRNPKQSWDQEKATRLHACGIDVVDLLDVAPRV